MKMLIATAALSSGLMIAGQAPAETVIVQSIYNPVNPSGAFTPGDTLGTILNTPLYETVDTKNAADFCASAGNCTYDFTFTITGLPTGSTTEIQAAAQTNSTPTV